ncbi:L-lactate permease [Halanaerobaculum tunisiense]
MWEQVINPLGNIYLSALVSAIPVLILFYALAVQGLKGHHAGILTLVSSILVALFIYEMPFKLAMLSMVYGVFVGLFPIGWIVLCAVFLYNLTVKTGYFEVIKDSVASITEDRRLQALLIAFCFGAFLEGAAGYGAPVAITAGMLVGLGFKPLYAAGLCLIANTAPVAFGGVGIPIITAGKVAGIKPSVISNMAANQLPLLSFVVPMFLVWIMSGWKGTKEVLPAILVTGISYSVSMWFVAAKIGPMLPNIVSSIVSIIALVSFLRVWKPKNIWRFSDEPETSMEVKEHPLSKIIVAWTPFIVLTILIANWSIPTIKTLLNMVTLKIPIGGLNNAILAGNDPISVVYKFDWLAAAGTAILLSAVISSIILGIKSKTFIKVFAETVNDLKFSLLTVASVLGFAYISNFSGITPTLGKALTVTGSFFPFVSPFLGWVGVFVTGSDTSANALFCNMQRITAEQIGINPVLTVTANTSGGVAAKMISPQSIAVASGSVDLVGKEGDLFRFTVKYSLLFTFIMGIVTYIQAYFLPDMIPEMIEIGQAANKTASNDVFGFTFAIVSLLVLAGLGILAAKREGNEVNVSA